MDLSNLNKNYLISPKLLYFFINLQFYTLHQFRGNFATDHFKFSKSEYGMMLGLLLFITFFTNIIIATMNDKFNKQRGCIVLLLGLSFVFFQLFFVQSYIKIVAFMFWVNLLLYLMVNTSIPPLLDKITLEYLGRIPNIGQMTYGRQRMFGTIGYLCANWIIESSITTKTLKKEKSGKTKKEYDFNRLKYYQAVTTAIAATLSIFLISHSTTTRRRSDIMSSWKELLKNKAYMFFIFIILLNGITRAAMTMYLTIYLTDIVKLEGYSLPTSWPVMLTYPINIFNNNPLATTAFFGVILEVFILYNSKYITKRFGLYWPLLFAQFFQLLRFTCYFLLNHDSTHAFVYVCIFEMMKGLNFGLTHTSAVQIATLLCPTHLKTTSQMIYSGTFTGLASVFSGLIFGTVFKSKMEGTNVAARIGSFQMFYMINVFINVSCVVLFAVKYGVLDRTLRMDVLLGKEEEQPMSQVKAKKAHDSNSNDDEGNDNGKRDDGSEDQNERRDEREKKEEKEENAVDVK